MHVKSEFLNSFFDAKREGNCCSKKLKKVKVKKTEFKKKEIKKIKGQTKRK